MCVSKSLQQRAPYMYTNTEFWLEEDGVCFTYLHPTKTHLSHSDMDWGRSTHLACDHLLVRGCFVFSSNLHSAHAYGKRPRGEPPCILIFLLIVMSYSIYGLWLVWSLELRLWISWTYMTLLIWSHFIFSLRGVSMCVCVCVNHLHRCKNSFVAGGMAAVSIAMPTKLRDSAGRECGGTLLHLYITYSPAPGRI